MNRILLVLFCMCVNVSRSSSSGNIARSCVDGDGTANADSGEASNASSTAAVAPTAAKTGRARAAEHGVGGGTNDGGGYGRGVQVLPASEIWFAHRKYRVVVCLDLSTSVFAQRWGEMPADSFVDATMMYIEVGV